MKRNEIKKGAPPTAIGLAPHNTSSPLVKYYITKSLDCQQSDECELIAKFAPKRADCVKLSDSYARLGELRKAYCTADCGTFLQYAHGVDDSGAVDPHGRLHSANFCRDRLCPMCAWRRTLKIYSQVSQIMFAMGSSFDYLFLTLTVPNCAPCALSDTISHLFRGFDRLFKRTRVKSAVQGYFRALEVTRNAENNTYHPHLHIILAVNPDYFSNGYIPHPEWLQMWRDAYGDQSITQVDIRRARAKAPGSDGLASAVAEIAKYAVKSGDYLTSDLSLTDSIISTLSRALRGRRLVHFGGIMRQVAKALKLDDPEDGDLINIGEELHPYVAQLIITYHWSAGCYGVLSREVVSLDAAEVIPDVPEGSVMYLNLDYKDGKK